MPSTNLTHSVLEKLLPLSRQAEAFAPARDVSKPECSRNFRSLASDDGFSSDEEVPPAKNSCSPSARSASKQSLANVPCEGRSSQVTPTLKQLSVAEKSTLTDETRRFDKRCGSPILTRNKETQADAGTKVVTLQFEMFKMLVQLQTTCDAETNTIEKSWPPSAQVNEKEGDKTFDLMDLIPNNNASSSTTVSSTHLSSSDLSAGQVSLRTATSHFIRRDTIAEGENTSTHCAFRSDCGLLVFNADGSMFSRAQGEFGHTNGM